MRVSSTEPGMKNKDLNMGVICGYNWTFNADGDFLDTFLVKTS